MLNIIWSSLIISSILFAFAYDINDELENRFNNAYQYEFSYKVHADKQSIDLISEQYTINAKLISNINQHHIIIPVSQTLPALWTSIAQLQQSKSKSQLRALIKLNSDNHTLQLTLPEVHWVKIRAITQAAFDMAGFAVKLVLGLIGIMALWLGLMKIAEQSGLLNIFVKFIRPLLTFLFPNIPKDHPALGSISLNLAANVLGLGNAATPMGIKAMQQLQELNSKKDTASDEMCMFLALNTSSVQLLPPVTLIALMGTQVSQLIIPIILATSASTITAIIVVKYFIHRSRQCSTAL